MAGFEKLRVGDVVVRMLAGTLPMKLQVSEITEQLIVCSAWQFDKATGAEIDGELGWGVDQGYHDSNYRRIEREGAVGVQSLLRLCKAFEVTLSELLDGLGKYPNQDLTSTTKNIARETSKVTKAKEKKSSPAQDL